MIKIQIFLVTIYQLTASNRLLLQQSIRGAYGQTCNIPAPDVICPNANTILTDQTSGTIECGVEFDCCLCKSITCGSPYKACDTFKAGAEYAVYGVKQVSIFGEVNGPGSNIDCNAFASCSNTYMTGSWINMIQCGAEKSCDSATMNFAMSIGLSCSVDACHNAQFYLNSNRGGHVNCISNGACTGAIIEINNIQDIKCGGDRSCSNAKITVTDPNEGFNLDCNGNSACENLELKIIISKSIYPCISSSYDVMSFKGITCASNSACEKMKLTIENNGCKTINIEDLQCSPDKSCFGSIFHFNAGTGPKTTLQNCMCGPSCRMATGIDACYNNMQAFECIDPRSCYNQIRTISNPSNDFLVICSNIESCSGLQLSISVTGMSQNLIRRIAGIYCIESQSCENTVISFQNQQMMTDSTYVTIIIESILCNANNACNGATFIIGQYRNVKINHIMCIDGACNNCMVKETRTSVGTPCQQFQPINVISNPTTVTPITTSTTTTTTTTTTKTPIITSTTTTTTTRSPVTTNKIIHVTTPTNPKITTAKPIINTTPKNTVIPIPVIPVIPIPDIPNASQLPVKISTTSGPKTSVTAATTAKHVPNMPKEIPPGFN